MANPPKSPTFDWEMYRYVPSLPGAAIGIVLFFILTLLLLWQWLRARSNLLIFVVIGALAEIGGYAARIGSHYDNQAWAPFIIQGVLLLVGPLFFAATIYTMLGRIILLAGGKGRTTTLAGGARISFIRPQWYTRLFVGADVFTLIIQGLGASIMGTMKLALAIAGEKIVIAGLAMQVATFVFFLIAAIDFQIRMQGKSSVSPAGSDWRKSLYILYSVSVLILLRCIFRLIEYSMGNAAYLISHEWTLYVFDTFPMLMTVILLLALRPTRYLAKDYGPGNNLSNK